MSLKLILTALLLAASLSAAEFHVSPTGQATNAGTAAAPWDIETALRPHSVIRPGDTIWLHGGRYGTGGASVFHSRLIGTAAFPIILRQFSGERAIIDGRLTDGPKFHGDITGAWTWFWGFEVTNSNGQRLSPVSERPTGLDLFGLGDKAINVIVHDAGNAGIGFWDAGDGGEVYGCLIWGNGVYDTGDPRFPEGWTRGSGIYSQNRDGTVAIRDVIAFRNFTAGFKAYSQGGHVNGFTVEGTVSFNNADNNFHVESDVNPVRDLKIIDNYTYKAPDDPTTFVRLGNPFFQDQLNAEVRGNRFVGGSGGALNVVKWRDISITDNLFAVQKPAQPWGDPAWLHYFAYPAMTVKHEINRNRYFGANPNQPMIIAPYAVGPRAPYQQISFAAWQTRTGFDANSTYSPNLPTANEVFIRPNAYERGRAHIVVYNWENKNTVTVSLASTGLTAGQAFRIQDAQDFFGAPAVAGTYSGASVALPMNLTKITPLVGQVKHFEFPDVHTPKTFGVFVVLPGAGGPVEPPDPDPDPDPDPEPEPDLSALRVFLEGLRGLLDTFLENTEGP